jgi:ceramide glucosyltransferase
MRLPVAVTMILGLLLVCACAGLASSTVYLVLVTAAARRFRRRRPGPFVASGSDGVELPRVSVLKPLHGLEPKLEDCLESFFTQTYGDFELVFAARNSADAAWPVVRKLGARHPHVKTSILYTGEPHYANAKVSALEKMIGAASCSYLVIADSDARVMPDCLTAVIRPLRDPRIGVVTCLYRGVPIDGLCSQLEALGMSVELTAGVLVADMLEGMRFALGPIMATRTDVLATVGGIGSLGEYCADDYVLGERAHAAGKSVLLSNQIIEHVVVNRSVRASLQHQVRWMRSTRVSRPKGHVGTGLTFAMPFGLLGAIVGFAQQHIGLAVGLFGWAVVNSTLLCLIVGWGVVRDRNARVRCWLYPLRDILGFAIWCASFYSSEIVWRDERYALEPGGRMRPVYPRAAHGTGARSKVRAPSRAGQ